MPRKERGVHARDAVQGQAAAADRPAGPRPASDTVIPLRRGDRADEVARAVDDERRHRREQAMAGQPTVIPPRLGDELRRANPFVLGEYDAGPPGGGPDEGVVR